MDLVVELFIKRRAFLKAWDGVWNDKKSKPRVQKGKLT